MQLTRDGDVAEWILYWPTILSSRWRTGAHLANLDKPGYIAHNGDSTVHIEISEMSDLKIWVHGNTAAVVTGAYHEKGISRGKPYE